MDIRARALHTFSPESNIKSHCSLWRRANSPTSSTCRKLQQEYGRHSRQMVRNIRTMGIRQPWQMPMGSQSDIFRLQDGFRPLLQQMRATTPSTCRRWMYTHAHVVEPAIMAKARWLSLPVGLGAGLFGSLVGVGGGVLVVPTIVAACKSIPQRYISQDLGYVSAHMHDISHIENTCGRQNLQPCK
jgi:hypothetical protein